MKTFMSLYDLDKLADDDPARPVVKQLLEWLIADGEFPDHPYDPEDHDYIALVEPGDVDRELDDIDMPRLTEIMFEGVSIIDGFYHAVYLGAGDYPRCCTMAYSRVAVSLGYCANVSMMKGRYPLAGDRPDALDSRGEDVLPAWGLGRIGIFLVKRAGRHRIPSHSRHLLNLA